MKIATVVMSLVFAGVVAQANEPAHDSHAAPAAATATETKVEKKEVVRKGKGHAKTTTTEEKKTEEKKVISSLNK